MATLTNTRLQTFTGSSNVAPIINANMQQIEAIFDPDHGAHLNDGTTEDVANVVRNRIFGDEPETLSGTTVEIDFKTEASKKYYDVAAELTFTFANVGLGRFVFLMLRSSGASETLNWPAGSEVVWLNEGGAPTVLQQKYMLVKLWCIGAHPSTIYVFGEYSVEP